MSKDDTVTKKRTTRDKKAGIDHAKDGAYAAINPASYKLGQLVNISYGGLVFKYIDKEDHYTSIQEKSIFLGNYGYYLGDMPITEELLLLTEMPMVTIEEVDFNQISYEHLSKIRQMRMEFTELTFKQIFALDKFIRENMSSQRVNSMHLTLESQ